MNARADLYSLGALLYALLARRPVFHGKSLAEMIYKQRFESPEPLRKHVPDVPEELERILHQLLRKEPDERVPNADILARRLEAMLHGLRLGPETINADADWFAAKEPAACGRAGKDIAALGGLPGNARDRCGGKGGQGCRRRFSRFGTSGPETPRSRNP